LKKIRGHPKTSFAPGIQQSLHATACIALYGIVLHYIALYCIELGCLVLHCIVLHCIVLYYIVFSCMTLCCLVFQRAISHCLPSYLTLTANEEGLAQRVLRIGRSLCLRDDLLLHLWIGPKAALGHSGRHGQGQGRR